MANQEHLDILKQGVDVWNGWREKHPEIKPDLTQAHLVRVTLIGANLNHANLVRANLNRADLSGAHLIEANLSRCS